MFTILHVATLFEATHLIRALRLERVRLPPWSRCYLQESAGVFLWISGIGKEATLRSLQRLTPTFTTLPQPRRWINIGIAGCNRPEIQVGTPFQVTRIHPTPHSTADPASPPSSLSLPLRLSTALPIAALTTVASAQHSTSASQTEAPSMLFDMEAYHWAAFLNTQFPSVPELACVKVVSDHADGTSLDFRALAPAYDSAIQGLLQHLSLLPSK